MTALVRHFLDLDALSRDELNGLIETALARKRARHGWPKAKPDADAPLEGRLLALLFEKPSTRTRVSFDMAMRQLGGETMVLDAETMQLGRGETVGDTARTLSRYVDAIMLRTSDHANLLELAHESEVPVINGLTDRSHPCQLIADVMTLVERKGAIEKLIVAWSGDGNNVAHSWIHAAAGFGFELRLACPKAYAPDRDVVAAARKNGAKVILTERPDEAAAGADCLVTDTFVSMGDDNAETRRADLAPYRIDSKLMNKAAKDAVFLHCLPAHRGEEVSAEVMDGPQSAVFDEAENRLHAQKAILLWCFGI